MLSILRSQLFQYKKRSMTATVFLTVLALDFSQLLLRMLFDKSFTASGYIIDSAAMTMFISSFFLIINTIFICTDDFSDKTVNYEIMTGHTRTEVFGARVLLSVITGLIGSCILLFTPTAVCAALKGWGTDIPVSDVLFRGFISLFPAVRIICEAAFLSFVVRKTVPAIVMAVIADTAVVQLTGSENVSYSVFLSTTNLNALFCFNPWAVYGLNDATQHITYDPAIGTDYILLTIAASLAFSLLFCFMGCAFFRQDDIE